MPRPKALERAVWIDRLRASLTILVIWHHAAITYGASGSWFFKATEETSLPLTLMAAVTQAFFMGLFFLISGALSTASLDRKGTTAFLADRALRLGLPVLVFGFLLGPLTVALASAPLSDVPRSAVDLILRGTFVLGPLWFPAVLLIFSIFVASWPTRRAPRKPVPRFTLWVVLALLTGLASLVIRQVVPVGEAVIGFQLGYFASYVVLFAIGVQAGRNGWLTRLPVRGLWQSVAAGLVALPILPAVLLSTDAPRFETGFSGPAIVYAFWEPLVALGAIAALIRWSQRSDDRLSALWSSLAENSYGAFILHSPILVAFSRVLENFASPNGLTLLVCVAATVVTAFSLTALIRRSLILRRVI